MGFFGLLIEGEREEMEIPPGYALVILMAAVDSSTSTSSTSLYVQPKQEDVPILVCSLGGKVDSHQCCITQEFCSEDSPVVFSKKGTGVIHLSGKWARNDEEDEEQEEDADEGHGKDADTRIEEELAAHHRHQHQQQHKQQQQQKQKRDQKQPDKEITKQSKGQKRALEEGSVAEVPSTSAASSTASKKKKSKKEKQEEKEEMEALAALVASPPVALPLNPGVVNRKKTWKVKPENDEGVCVPEPKQVATSAGVLICDYVIGKGIVPKGGAKVKLTYEGSYPDGTVFDSNLKRSKPFIFRKGAAQVIKGLDAGIEGMRVGGSREIIVPPELG